MRNYGKVLPTFWMGKTGKEIKKRGLSTQVTALYLMTCPHANMIGVYYLPLSYLSHDTDIPFKEASKAIHSLEEIDFCTYDFSAEYVWIHNMALYQVGNKLKPQDNRVKNINEIYEKLPNLQFLPSFFEKYKDTFWLNTPRDYAPTLKPLLSQKQEQEQKQEKASMSGSLKSQAEEVLSFLNEKTGRVYRPVDTNLKLIIARLKSGATVLDCRQVIAKKTREWRSDVKMNEYLRPATLFNATKFEQYMGELVALEEETTYVTN